jgi:hypothetical protein
MTDDEFAAAVAALPNWPLIFSVLGAILVAALLFHWWISRKEQEAWAEYHRCAAEARAAFAALR